MKRLILLFALIGAALEAQTLCNWVIPPGAQNCPVDGSTGVTAGGWVKWNSAGTALINGATTDTAAAFFGIASTTGTGSTTEFYTIGPAPGALFDGAATAGNYFTISATSAHQLHDQGTTTPNNASLGKITATIGSSGATSISIRMPAPNNGTGGLRSCDISVGDTSGSAITNAQLGPQSRVCYITTASTILELDVNADAGTPNVIVGRNHAGTITNIVSGALATAASGGIACSNTGGTTGLNGATTCSATLQNTALAVGDYIELVSGTAGGTAKFFVAHILYRTN